MKKTYLFLLITLAVFSSCKVIAPDYSSLRQQTKLQTMLPPLKPIIDMQSLENAYSSGMVVTAGRAYSRANTFGGVSTSGLSTSTYQADPKVQDVAQLFEKEVKNNISNFIGEQKGSIRLKIMNYNCTIHSMIFKYMLSSMGAGLLMLIPTYSTIDKMLSDYNTGGGLTLMFTAMLAPMIPLNFVFKPNASQEVELEVEIYNQRGDVIGRYSSFGSEKFVCNQVAGFNRVYNERASNLKVVKEALENVKGQIDKDSARLLAELNKGNNDNVKVQVIP